MQILGDLQRQRETILHTRDTLAGVDVNISKSRQVGAARARWGAGWGARWACACAALLAGLVPPGLRGQAALCPVPPPSGQQLFPACAVGGCAATPGPGAA